MDGAWSVRARAGVLSQRAGCSGGCDGVVDDGGACGGQREQGWGLVRGVVRCGGVHGRGDGDVRDGVGMAVGVGSTVE